MDTQPISNNTPAQLFQSSDDALAEPDKDTTTVVLYGVILIGVIVLVAHYAGFNVFGYLGKGTDAIGNAVFPVWEKILGWWASLLEMLGYGAVEQGKDLGRVAAKGTQSVAREVGEGAEEVEHLLDDEEDDAAGVQPSESVSGGKKSKNGEKPITKASALSEDENDLDTSIESSELKRSINNTQPTSDELEKAGAYKPNDIFSGAPKASPGTNKSGWCYIGTYSGYRSCSRVGEADKCMSGDIFPTHDVCVNPNLRA